MRKFLRSRFRDYQIVNLRVEANLIRSTDSKVFPQRGFLIAAKIARFTRKKKDQ